MEHQKIIHLLNEANDYKFVTRKWNIANHNSKANYEEGNEVTYNIEVLKSNLCNYNNAYILVRGYIIVTAAPQTQLAFENCAPFTKCIIKIDGTTIDEAENLDLVMPVYNLIKYSSNYSQNSRSLWFYLWLKIYTRFMVLFMVKDEATNFNNNIANRNNFKSFKYKDTLLENTAADPAPNAANGILRNAAIAVPLKYLSNFWKLLEIPLINCKLELKLKWTKYSVLSAAGNENNINEDANVNNIIFTINDTKFL